MTDLAVVTGGQVVSEDVGLKLDSVGLEVLGTARRVTVTKDTTTVVDGGGTKEAIADRVAQIRREIEATDSDWDREKLQERLAKLAGGIGVIKVGAATEVELKERKHRIEDAIAATRAAVEEGVIPGGGSALVHAATAIDALDLSGDELTGARAVRRALDAPLVRIADNAGLRGPRRRQPRSATSAPGRASTPPPASTATWPPRASSTRSRSPRPRWATPRRSPRWCSPPTRPSSRRRRRSTTTPAGPPHPRPLARRPRPQPLGTRPPA